MLSQTIQNISLRSERAKELIRLAADRAGTRRHPYRDSAQYGEQFGELRVFIDRERFPLAEPEEAPVLFGRYEDVGES